jgi:hypothetical protein
VYASSKRPQTSRRCAHAHTRGVRARESWKGRVEVTLWGGVGGLCPLLLRMKEGGRGVTEDKEAWGNNKAGRNNEAQLQHRETGTVSR